MDDKAFQSITEMAEPADASADLQSTLRTPNLQPSMKRLYNSQTTSATNSPKPSRESSPVRPPQKPGPSSRAGSGRPRKPGSQEVSPSRSNSVTSPPPLPSITHRALSATAIPQLYPPQPEQSIRAPIPQKTTPTAEIRDIPRWPVSPRLRSPPPINKPVGAPRKTEQDLPAINVQRTAAAVEGAQSDESEDSLTISGMRTPVRGVNGTGSTLETVQEISQPGTPALDFNSARETEEVRRSLSEQDTTASQAFARPLKQKPSGANESGSESGGNKGEIKMRSTTASASTLRSAVTATKSLTASNAGRGKPSGEGSTKNMTVETETVSSIPQVAVGGGAGGTGNNNSLRAKPSSETIRPKKEKKKAARKTPSVTSGAASSKADIFEAKIASAVDEANSSDSEETFVYESNPPETSERPRRFHSRTPSATSMVSQVDQRGNARPMHGVMDSGHSVAMKKSMKFANSYSSNGPDTGTGEDDGKGTAKSNVGTGRGTTHHHHIGRWGRSGGNGHQSLFDNESPFPHVVKSKFTNGSRNSSQPSSPRGPSNKIGNGKKTPLVSSGYDIDDGAGADDERTPLMGSSVRSTRSGRYRRQPFSLRQLEHQASRQNPSFLNRFAGCLVLSITVLLVISGAIGFMFATTQPLSGVKIVELKNVIASEQEIMFDMAVSALNPNVIVITVDSVAIEVFAKSKHAGTDAEWWRHPQVSETSTPGRVYTRDDSPSDPPLDHDPDDPNEATLLKLGSISRLDSALMFDGSPFEHKESVAAGELSLQKPGNKTEPGGSERWSRVLQYEFDLIVKGTLKYQLPMSQRIRSVAVNGRILVKPAKTKLRFTPELGAVVGDGEEEMHIVRDIEVA